MGQCVVDDDPLLAGVIETETGDFIKDVEVNLNTNVGINDMKKLREVLSLHVESLFLSSGGHPTVTGSNTSKEGGILSKAIHVERFKTSK